MDKFEPAIKPAKSEHSLKPLLPGNGHIGPLKDMAQDVTAASAALEGRMAGETAAAIGRHLRLVNSYHSNLIEGHKTTIPDIQMALRRDFHKDPEKKYTQELCAAHVETEQRFMETIRHPEPENICSADYLSRLHAAFYESLPEAHRFTHSGAGFTGIPVFPGKLRDVNVSVDSRSAHGPDFRELPPLMTVFAEAYDPGRHHGDERLIAMAAAHHRLTWLHPFRDGNGRVARLFSGIYLARAGVNRSNLWSLSRGLSRNKQQYMMELWATDSSVKTGETLPFKDELLADFCRFFLGICLDQVRFTEQLLRLDRIESRIDWYVETRSRNRANPLRPEAARLIRAVFMRGAIPRGMAPEILNMTERTARRTVGELIAEGLIESASHRAPLTIGLPMHVLPYYFPDLFHPSVVGEEYMEKIRPQADPASG